MTTSSRSKGGMLRRRKDNRGEKTYAARYLMHQKMLSIGNDFMIEKEQDQRVC